MRIKNLKASKTAALLSVCAAMVLCTNFVGSCSADDEDVYYGDELKTRAKATRSESPEIVTGDPLVNLNYQCEPGGCGVWCVGYLKSERSDSALNALTGHATELKSDWKELGGNAYFIISLSRLGNVNLNSCISSQYQIEGESEIRTDQSRVTDKINELNENGAFKNKIISVGTNHWYVAKEIIGKRIKCVDADSYPGTTMHPISSVTELVY